MFFVKLFMKRLCVGIGMYTIHICIYKYAIYTI